MKTMVFTRKIYTLLRASTFVVTLLATTVLPMFSNLPSALAGSDTYPTSIAGCRAVSGSPAGYFTCDLKDSAQDTLWDPWSEYNRECTSYTAWMLSSVNGFTMPFHDDAVGWGSDASSLGYKVDMNPQVGSIFWSKSIDHVGWVESVSADNSTVNYLDYNYNLNGLWSEHINVPISSASGYIHFKDIGSNPPAPTSPVPWNFTVMDGDSGSLSGHVGDDGRNPVSVNFSGSLQMFYYDATNHRLRHAWNGGSGWNFEDLDGQGGGNGRTTDDVGAASCATVYSGTLQLFYYDATAQVLRHAWSDANGWHFETLDSSGNVGTACTALVYGTTLQLFYPNLSNGDLRHAWSDANGWHFENLDGDSGSIAGSHYVASVGNSLTSTLDSNGAIQLFYYSPNSQGLRHAWNGGSGWNFENLDGGSLGPNSGDSDSIGQNPSVTMGGSDIQLFTYNASLGALRHMWSDPHTGWHFENLDGYNSTGPHQYNLGLYSSDIMNGTTLQVFYYGVQFGVLWHAYSDSNGWHFEDLDGLGGSPTGRVGPNYAVGKFPNAAVFNSQLQTFYYDNAGGKLRQTVAQ